MTLSQLLSAPDRHAFLSGAVAYLTGETVAFSGGDVATFTLGTPNCEINGVGMSLEAPVFLKDDVIYLPVDFFYRRMNCFEYTFSSPLNANVLTFLPEVPPGLVAHVMTSSPRIDPATVPAAPATQNT